MSMLFPEVSIHPHSFSFFQKLRFNAMAMFFSKLSSSLASPLLQRLPAATFPHITFLKLSLLSTSIAAKNDTPTSNLHPEISEFLLKECGLCQSELLAVTRRWKTLLKCRSAHTGREAVKFLKDSGCTDEQVKTIITKNLVILSLKTNQQLKPKFELLKILGFTGKDLACSLSKGHRLLGSNLGEMSVNIKYLQSMWESKASVLKALKRAPQLLVYRDGPEIWENKLRYLASFGLLEDEIRELVKKDPVVLIISMDKMQKNMDFLVHTAKLPVNIVLRYPMLLLYSVEGRLKPRLQVLKSNSALQPFKRLSSLVPALLLGEQKFLDKYVKCSPDAKKLFDIYSGKSVHIDMTL